MRTTPREVQDFSKIKALFSLSEIQKAVLLGTILGDGSLKRRGKYCRLHIKHSKNQLIWAEYKRKVFANITNMPVRIFSQKVNNKSYEFCEFVTLTHPEFSKFQKRFYPEGKKKIPEKLLEDFKDPLSLAVWFMDDGSTDWAGALFHTQCFTKGEVNFLRKILRNNFNLRTSCRKNKNGWVIYIPKDNLSLFKSLIGRHILPEFEYKLRPYSTRLKT